jgi:tryptophanyl-tRNA synthetase
MDLRDPTSKMSKSSSSVQGRISLTDTPEEIKNKIKAAQTDSLNLVTYEPSLRPGVANLLEILSAFDASRQSPEDLAKGMDGASLKILKTRVADTLVDGLAGIRERYQEISSKGNMDKVAAEGAGKARANSLKLMTTVREALGV